MEGTGAHLKAMKDLTARQDRNDNVCEGMQQTSLPIIPGTYAHPIKWQITIFMDLFSQIKNLLQERCVYLVQSRVSGEKKLNLTQSETV